MLSTRPGKSVVTVVLLVGAAGLVATAGCFGSSTQGAGRDAGIALDGTVFDGAGLDAGGGPDGGAHDGSTGGARDGGDAGDGSVVCPKSTCTSVEVKFIGWAIGSDGGVADCELAVDDGTPDGGPNGTVVLATNPADPSIGNRNALVGNFVTDTDGGIALPVQYATDNNGCDVPDFPARQDAYYLVPMQGLPVAPSWQGLCGCGGNCGGACDDAGAGYLCDYEQGYYSQSCPNFGFNCVSTPERIEAIEVVATTADPTCKVCVYDGVDPSGATAVRCASPGSSIAKSAFVGADGGATFPALVRLDDGSGCAYY